MAKKDRDESGRFLPGNAGGPGRPAKKPDLSEATLRDLAMPMSGAELYVMAVMLADRERWMEFVRSDFPAQVARRVELVVAISDLARNEVLARLRNAVAS